MFRTEKKRGCLYLGSVIGLTLVSCGMEPAALVSFDISADESTFFNDSLNTSESLEKSEETEKTEPSLGEVPSYFGEHLRNKAYSIEKIRALNRIDYTFAFITDLHWETNRKSSPSLIRNICFSTQVDKIVLGGDYSSYDRDDANETMAVLESCSNAFSFWNTTAIVGNHDTNCNLNNGTPEIPANQVYSVTNRTEFDQPFSKELDAEKKICSLYLYSGTGMGSFQDNNQKSFIYNTLVDLDETWSVVIFIHAIFGNDNGVAVLRPVGEEFIEYITSIKSSLRCNIVGAFSGHCHLDRLSPSTYSIPLVSTMCDSIGFYDQDENYYLREVGTFTEQAFDVVQVDTTNHKVFLTRIGAGSDRLFVY